ncbi:hypothetical protein [Sphingomonas flavescens]|uniref:hypothetical protein n=1 Tax=Sphingomonas flavescens TaxID=3132797 RepID=UPI00280407A6|nr:hypothetical protein [Sphingomonas limnosediminicola]
MNGSGTPSGMGWGARLLIAFILILAGAAATVWSLARYEPAARFFGIAPKPSQALITSPAPAATQQPSTQPAPTPTPPQIAQLENRIAQVENATERAAGSAGRADALVIAFAARRAIDRGVALGYLENLLTARFAAQHQAAVATIITGSHQPVRLNDLISEYQLLAPDLRSGGPQDSWWANTKRELGSLIQVHRADRPATTTEARYNQALLMLQSGDADQALAETMRLPGAASASAWTTKARRYVAVHRALDEIESAALMTGGTPPAQ